MRDTIRSTVLNGIIPPLHVTPLSDCLLLEIHQQARPHRCRMTPHSMLTHQEKQARDRKAAEEPANSATQRLEEGIDPDAADEGEKEKKAAAQTNKPKYRIEGQGQDSRAAAEDQEENCESLWSTVH